jgi:hypothetical protein
MGIDAEKANYPVSKMCEWMDVSRSGFHEWRGRAASATAQRQGRLKILIRHVFTDSDGTYGYRRVHAQLVRLGVEVGDELVRRLMRGLGLVACQPRPWRPVTTIAGDAATIPDLVRRDFTAAAPGTLVAGDTSGSSDIFVRDRLTGTTQRVSVSSAGRQGNGGSGLLSGMGGPSISADGRYVASTRRRPTWSRATPTTPPTCSFTTG